MSPNDIASQLNSFLKRSKVLGGFSINNWFILRKLRKSITLTKFTLVFSLVFLFLVACSTQPVDPTNNQPITGDNPALHELENTNDSAPMEQTNSQVHGSADDFPLDPGITDQFQTIYIDPDQVKILHTEIAEWPDSCLGIEQIGVDCIPETTTGYVVVLEVKGLEFAYHSNAIGSQVQPATQGIIWSRDDGGQTKCDRLIIFLPDTANVCWCENGEMHARSVNLQEILNEEEYELMIDSLTTFTKNTVNQPSSDQPQSVMVSLTFNGQGDTFPNADQQASLNKMAELIFERITTQN